MSLLFKILKLKHMLACLLAILLCLSGININFKEQETNIASVSLTESTVLAAEKKKKTIFDLLFKKKDKKKKKKKKKAAKKKATAKKKKKRKSFFSLLFGRKDEEPKKVVKKAAASTTAIAVAKVLPKNENAKKIMVVGDTLSSGLIKGMKQFYAKNQAIKILSASQAKSGFARTDIYDWPKEAKGLIDEHKPDMAVVFMGLHDNQAIQNKDDVKLAKFSQEWTIEFAGRIRSFIKHFHTQGIPVIWVGLPPTKNTKIAHAWKELNEIYRIQSFGPHSTYLDIWDIFTSEDGKYTRYGADLKGQRRLLRRKNHMHFTLAGNVKLTHFIDREFKRTINQPQLLAALNAGSADDAFIALLNEGQEKKVDIRNEKYGPIISLNRAPTLTGRPVLAGQDIALIKTGNITRADQKTADDFSSYDLADFVLAGHIQGSTDSNSEDAIASTTKNEQVIFPYLP